VTKPAEEKAVENSRKCPSGTLKRARNTNRQKGGKGRTARKRGKITSADNVVLKKTREGELPEKGGTTTRKLERKLPLLSTGNISSTGEEENRRTSSCQKGEVYAGGGLQMKKKEKPRPALRHRNGLEGKKKPKKLSQKEKTPRRNFLKGEEKALVR